MSKQKWEVVFTTGGSVHVFVHADTKEEACEIATPIALQAFDEYGDGIIPNTDERADVYLGDVEDVAYVDPLGVEA
jgi:hypothetical protein